MFRLAFCRKMKVTLVLALAHSLASHPASSSADEPYDDESIEVFPLPEIVVTANKIKAPPTIITRVVGLEDIEAWNATTAGDALTWVPGVNVQVGGSSADSRAWIRGFRDRDVLVLYDGIPIASGFEGTLDLNEISLQSVSTIKVMKSAPSVIYGTNGMGGVIDVIPATGFTGHSFGGRAELGSNEGRLFRAYANGGSGNFGYSVSASHQQADDFSLSDDYTPELNQPDDKRVNSDFKRNSLFVRLEGSGDFLGDTALFVNYSDADKGLPVETGVDDPDYERLTDSKRLTLGLSNDFRLIPLSLKIYYNSYDSELSVFTDSSFTEIDEIELAEDYSWGGKLYSIIETSERNTIILTVGGQKDVFKGEGELEEGNRAEITTWTLAAEDEFWMTDKLSLAAGLIYTYFDQTLLNKGTSALNPQIAVAWQATDQFSLHASAAQRTRFPKLRELYRDRYGNPDLHEQEAHNYEIGFRYQHSGAWSSDFAVFHSNIDGLIERPSRRSTYRNLDRVTLKGVELSSGGWISDKLFLRAGYTYVDAEESLEDNSNRQLRSRPKHTGLVEFRYQFPGQWLLTTNGIYVSGLFDLSPDGVYTEVDDYFVGNLKLNKTLTPRFDGYISISNVLDADYVQRIGYPREGRAFVVGVEAAF